MPLGETEPLGRSLAAELSSTKITRMTVTETQLENRHAECITPAHNNMKKPKHILVADDDFEMVSLVAAALERDGHHVEVAGDGAELLERLADAYLGGDSMRFDLIVTDHRMPRVAGMDVLRGLGLSGHTPPVILMTAFGGAEMRELAKKWGAVAVFDKPFEMDDLRTAVQFVFSESFATLHSSEAANDQRPTMFGAHHRPRNGGTH